MPLRRPTLQELIDRTNSAIAGELGVSPLLRQGVLAAFARALAGASHGIHGHIEWAVDQALPDTASAEYLVRWASIFGVTRKPATFAAGDLIFSGSDGAVVPQGTRVGRADGTEYATETSATIVSGVAVVNALAVLAGEGGNAPAGTGLSTSSPIAGVNATSAVGANGIVGGAEEESDDALRVRALLAIRSPKQGGAASDYIQWALEVPEVTRAWVYPLYQGPGSVGVAIALDGRTPITPDQAKLDEVAAHIDIFRPVTAEVFVWAPVLVPVDVSIEITPQNAETEAAVRISLEDAIRLDATPGSTLLRSTLLKGISSTPEILDFDLTVPVDDVALQPNELATLGVITWL